MLMFGLSQMFKKKNQYVVKLSNDNQLLVNIHVIKNKAIDKKKSWIDITLFFDFFSLSQQEIINWYKDRIKNKIEPQLPKFFKDLPNLPVE